MPRSVLNSLCAMSRGSSSGPSQRNSVIGDSLRKGLFTELWTASKEPIGVVIAHRSRSDLRYKGRERYYQSPEELTHDQGSMIGAEAKP